MQMDLDAKAITAITKRKMADLSTMFPGTETSVSVPELA